MTDSDEDNMNSNNQPNVKVQKIIDMKLPLSWLLGVTGLLALLIINLVMNVAALTKSVGDLETTVKSGNASMSTLSAEVSLLKFRADTHEFNQKRTDEMIRQLSGGRK